MNKIEKEIEIHARKTLKVPMNAHSILLSTGTLELPTVHKSGQNSPTHANNNTTNIVGISNPLQSDDSRKLDEKLLIASVSLSGSNPSSSTSHISNINDIIFLSNAEKQQRQGNENNLTDDDDDERQPLFNDDAIEEGRRLRTSPHAIRGAPKADLNCSGSDCDISWIVLLVGILALCFAIPLIYVIYIAEHPEQFHHNDSVSFIVG